MQIEEIEVRIEEVKVGIFVFNVRIEEIEVQIEGNEVRIFVFEVGILLSNINNLPAIDVK